MAVCCNLLQLTYCFARISSSTPMSFRTFVQFGNFSSTVLRTDCGNGCTRRVLVMLQSQKTVKIFWFEEVSLPQVIDMDKDQNDISNFYSILNDDADLQITAVRCFFPAQIYY